MAGDLNSKFGAALDQFSGTRETRPAAGPYGKLQGQDGKAQSNTVEDSFAGEFAKLKLSIIRPVFSSIGNMLQERGHEFNISEEPGGKISIHIVPAGVNKSIHGYDWFPTLSFFSAPFTKTIGLHGRNMRPNAEGSSGNRGDFTLAQVTQDLVERELMKFIGEIANW